MLSRTQVQLWYNRFKEGREDVNDNARSGLFWSFEHVNNRWEYRSSEETDFG